ncbi:hypothetical protein [Saccharopolyspora spinosa]|uniref:hypothetical protein n=1 Tax=Saccharopolyspora spinosa TaxID=60894 RepID=UPI000237B430|nr:hypothetical protein [Saccharopolyspora spinosa]
MPDFSPAATTEPCASPCTLATWVPVPSMTVSTASGTGQPSPPRTVAVTAPEPAGAVPGSTACRWPRSISNIPSAS